MTEQLYPYGRTYHFPFSEGMTRDDKQISDPNMFGGEEVEVSVKMDGENSSLYPSYYHARSEDSRHHESQSWIKKFHGEVRGIIPPGWRLCGENMFACHSIAYENLESYFYLFSIWNEDNVCLSVDETREFAQMYGFIMPRVIGRFVIEGADFRRVETLYRRAISEGEEGIVVRKAGCYSYEDFSRSLAKAVRPDHNQTGDDWRRTWKKNNLKTK